MNNNVSNLKKLEAIIESVTQGNLEVIKNIEFDVSIATEFEKRMLHMFQVMAEREQLLEEQSSDLVKQVNQRTKELEDQKMINIHNSKMSALGEMAGGIAHEINTPLATMKMLVGSAFREIDKEIFDVEFVTDKLTKINITIDRIAKIVKGLKTFSRDGSQDPFVSTNLKTIIDDTVFFCKERFRNKEVDLTVQIENEELNVDCRASQISQVLLNLLSNSIDAIEKDKTKWVQIHQKADDLWAYILITDSGLGIPKDVKQKIFDPFFTTKGVEKGTGLGLSISLGIIKNHQGEMTVNGDCKNTQFVIKLPRKRA
jgi:C4-dicarboxylate-specific signal transduction histidine kinase